MKNEAKTKFLCLLCQKTFTKETTIEVYNDPEKIKSFIDSTSCPTCNNSKNHMFLGFLNPEEDNYIK